MGQRLLNVRVRPARITILINRNAADPDLFLAFEFFSKHWGGRFYQIIPVEKSTCDDLTSYRLACTRPDFVYGIGLDDQYWLTATHKACQRRGYGPLQPELVHNIREHHPEEHCPVDLPLVHLFRTRERRGRHKRALRLVTPDSLCPFSTYCVALFGVHHQNLHKEFFDQETKFSAMTPTALIELATEFVREWQQSWLDMTGHGLHGGLIGWGELEPTVVLVHHKVDDLSLF